MSWVYDKRTGQLVSREEYAARKYRDVAVSDLPRPMVISDALDRPLRNMVDGKMYDSKAAMRRVYRERGYVEVGNETQKMPPKPKVDRAAVRLSVRKALSQVGIPT